MNTDAKPEKPPRSGDAEKFEYKYAPLPSGNGDQKLRRHQRSPCTQWPWAAKNKSNIPFGPGGAEDEEDEIKASFSPKKHVTYPWSHQHKSEALDFVRSNPDMKNWKKDASKSMYKSDFVPTGNDKLLGTVAGKPSNKSVRSLSGTNIRRTKSKAAPKDRGQQRWTSKVIEGKTNIPKTNSKGTAPDGEDLDQIANLNLDEVIGKLQTEGNGTKGIQNPFYHVSERTK